MVLRRFPAGDSAAAREAHVLAALDGLDGWAPSLLDVDAEGARFGEPAILITRLAGGPDITPASPTVAAAQLGQALALIHAVPTTSLPGLRDGTAAATASAAQAAGSTPAGPILAAHVHRLADQRPVLTHYDFWSGNALWHASTLTGIVDWSGASLAPRGFDVSWCRLDLALLHGPAAADTFAAAYEEATHEAVADMTLWDLFALTNSHHSVGTWWPNYHDLGRTDLTAAVLHRRHAEWTEECLARLARHRNGQESPP